MICDLIKEDLNQISSLSHTLFFDISLYLISLFLLISLPRRETLLLVFWLFMINICMIGIWIWQGTESEILCGATCDSSYWRTILKFLMIKSSWFERSWSLKPVLLFEYYKYQITPSTTRKPCNLPLALLGIFTESITEEQLGQTLLLFLSIFERYCGQGWRGLKWSTLILFPGDCATHRTLAAGVEINPI